MRLPIALAVLATSSLACSPPAPRVVTPQQVAAGSPLGPSYFLVPLPNDDENLLGRVLLKAPEGGRSLDEVSRPNECAGKLTDKKIGPLASTFEDGQELSTGGQARAALGAFGFEGDAQTATHFYYKLEVNKRVAQSDTTEYVQCCKEKGSCGYGFVSALIYGDGEYATAAESSAQGSVTLPVAGGAGGFVKARVLHRRNVRGYVAAVITVTDPKASVVASNPIGDTAAAAGISEAALPETVKGVYAAGELQIRPSSLYDASGQATPSYAIADSKGAISENEFVRRFHKLTGSGELDEFNRNRRTTAVPLGWVMTAAFPAFVALSVYGWTHLSKTGTCNASYNPTPCTQGDTAGIAPAVLGTLGAVGTGVGAGVLLGIGYGDPDGPTESHLLSESEARLLVTRYNRALLRKTIRDTQKAYQDSASLAPRPVPALTVKPWIGLGFAGLSGSF